MTEEDVEDVLSEDEEDETPRRGRKTKKPKKKIAYGEGRVFPEYFANTPEWKRTIRIDTKLLADAESDGSEQTQT